MDDIIPFPFLNLERKQDSAAKLAAVADLPTKEHLFAPEINLIVTRINQLKQLLDALSTTAEEDSNNQVITLGEIGSLPIHQVVRNLDPARSIQANYLRIFRAALYGMTDNYLYTGPGGLVGFGNIQPQSSDFYAISGNFLNGGEILVTDPTATPNEVTTVLQIALNNLYAAILSGGVSNLQTVLEAGNEAKNQNIELVEYELDEPTGSSAKMESSGAVILRRLNEYIQVHYSGIEFHKGAANFNLRQGNGASMTVYTPNKPTGEYTMATIDDIDEVLSSFTTQEILSGGNYNNLEVTADLLVFKNENAQAILNGIWGKKDFHILNLSNTYEVKINHNSASVTGNGQPIKLPTASGNMGIKGTARILKTDGYGYFVADTWGSLYRPEYKGLTKKAVQTVDEFSNAGSMETTEFMVFRDAQSAPMSKADLNLAYPDAKRPFQVVCNALNLIYMNIDSSNNWKSIPLTTVV